METILAAVEAVDWPTLAHAYGPATDTAGHLRAALGGDAAAIGELGMSLYHQGGCVYSAAAAAVPILIEVSCEPAFAHRGRVLGVLTDFARLLGELREPWRSAEEAQALRVTMEAALPRFIELLDDAEPGVREAAAGLVASYDSGSGSGTNTDADADTRRAADALRRRFLAESDHRVRVVLLLSLGKLSSRLSADDRADLATWANEATETDRRARLAGLIAQHQLAGGAATADILDALADPALVLKDYSATADTAGGLVNWVSHRIDDGRFQLRLASWALHDDTIRTSGSPVFMQVGGVMVRSREATSVLLPDIAQLLGHSMAEVRVGAAHLLAATGRSAQPYADLLVEATHDPQDAVAVRAVWALAALGDSRAIPDLIQAIDGTPERFAARSIHYRAELGRFMVTDLPGLVDVLTPMGPHADALLPALRRRLARETATPALHHLTEALASFGPVAAAALPELRALLDTPNAELACNVLGSVGPDAGDAAEDLRRVGTSSQQDAAATAWAYLRIAGDADPFLRAVSFEQGLSGPHQGFRRAADLGPRGLGLADRFATMLNADQRYWPSWPGIEAAHAHWRITGDPALCLDVFDTALDPLRHGRQLPISRQVLRYLPALGSAAAVFRPLLENMVAGSERLIYSGGWRGIAEDDEAVGLARIAISAISAR